MIFIIGFFVGAFLMALIVSGYFKRKNNGTILVYPPSKDEPQPYLFLELNAESANIQNKSYVLFKVRNVPSSRK